jgi:Ca2+-binding EF-hand superfamily protein
MANPLGRLRLALLGAALFCPPLLTTLVAVSAVRSAEERKVEDPSAAEDVQDIVYFGERQPVLLRLHLRLDGKPAAARWTEYMTRLFAFLDRDGDGLLDKEEAIRLPSPQTLQAQCQGNVFGLTPFGTPSLEQMDRDHDGKVSPDEFIRYYRDAAGPVVLAQTVYFGAADLVSDALFNHLDADHDGRLSMAELDDAERRLTRLDQNDDECVSPQELLEGSAGRAARMPQGAQPVASQKLKLVPREDGPRRITRRLEMARAVLAHYDRDSDRKLSPDEIAWPKEAFERLDRNGDGRLDALELLRWVIVKPDVEAVVHLGKPGDRGALIEAVSGAPANRPSVGNRLSFSLADGTLNLVRAPAVFFNNAANMRANLQQQLRNVDRERKGYVTRKQVEGQQFALLRGIMDLADRDDDGHFTEQEANAWADLVSSAAGCQATAGLAENGRALFGLLDTNGDGRLGIRELRQVRQRLAAFDRDADGRVMRQEIPQQFQLVINQGQANFAAYQPVAGGAPQAASPPRGPLWFRKMDRNGDGDVSVGEFLGSSVQFRRLDTDGDGLISLEEAERADAALRKPAAK